MLEKIMEMSKCEFVYFSIDELTEKFKKEVLSDTESKFVHKVFDLQIEWQDKIEKKHYDNLCK